MTSNNKGLSYHNTLSRYPVSLLFWRNTPYYITCLERHKNNVYEYNNGKYCIQTQCSGIFQNTF